MARLTIVLVSVLMISMVVAEGVSGGGEGGPSGSQDRSNVTCSASASGIDIKSESNTDISRDRIEIDIEVSGSGGSDKTLQARLRSYSRASDSSGGAQAAVDFSVQFSKIIEYVEVDGVPGYSSNDTQGIVVNVGDNSYTFTVLPDETTGTSVIKVVRATSNTFQITARMGSALFNNSGVFTLTNSVKIDVDISNFAYTLGSQARLALVVGVLSAKTRFVTQRHDDDQPHVDSDKVDVRTGSSSGPVDAFFSWATTVDVTSPAATVGVIASPMTIVADSSDTDNDHRQIVYSFDALRPITIHWDPLIGLGALSSASTLSISLCFLMALIWSALAL